MSLWSRVANVFRSDRLTREIEEEIQSHIEEAIEQGRDPAEARRAFGSTLARREESRDLRLLPWLDSLRADAVFGWRQVLQTKASSAVAVLSLALGVGATTAVFSAVYGILLRPLPLPQAQQLTVVWSWNNRLDAPYYGASMADYQDWRRHNTSFENLAAVGWRRFTLNGKGEPQSVLAFEVTPNFFDVFQVPPALGPAMSERDLASAGASRVVLAYSYWKASYGADPNIVGKVLVLDDAPYTVAGVAAPAIEYRQDFRPQVFTLLQFRQEDLPRRSRRGLWVIGRLRDGVTRPRALAEMRALARRLESEYPDTNRNWSVKMYGLQELLTDGVRRPLLLLYGAAGLILLLACVNTGCLLLVRAARRRHELAVRHSLGAGRSRLVRQLLVESLLVACTGGALGSLLAFLAVDLLNLTVRHIAPAGISGETEVRVYAPVWLFTLTVTLAAGILSGLHPALQASRVSAAARLASGGRAPGLGRTRSLGGFVVAEIALSFVLLMGAGLLTRSLLNLVKASPGFNPGSLLAVEVSRLAPGRSPDQQRAEFARRVVERLGAVPGVVRAASVSIVPLGGNQMTQGFRWEKRPTPPNAALTTELRSASVDYFETMGIPLVRGRAFEPNDDGRRPVAVVDSTFVRRYLSGEDAVGQRLFVGQALAEIVGEVGSVKLGSLGDVSLRPHLYLPPAQFCPANVTFVARCAECASVAASVRRAILEVDPVQPILHVGWLQDMADDSISSQRTLAVLVSVLATLALLLSTLGVYAAAACHASERTREMAIRMTLGARPWLIVRAELLRGAVLCLAGLVLGVAGSLALSRLFVVLLYETRRQDPALYLGVAVLLSCVVLAACWPPARHVSQIDPTEALRGD